MIDYPETTLHNQTVGTLQEAIEVRRLKRVAWFMLEWLFPIVLVLQLSHYVLDAPLGLKLCTEEWPPVWELGIGISCCFAWHYRRRRIFKTFIRNLFFSLFTAQWILVRGKVSAFSGPPGKSLLLALAIQTILLPCEIAWLAQYQPSLPACLQPLLEIYDYFATLLLAALYGRPIASLPGDVEWSFVQRQACLDATTTVRNAFAMRIGLFLLPIACILWLKRHQLAENEKVEPPPTTEDAEGELTEEMISHVIGRSQQWEHKGKDAIRDDVIESGD